MFTVVFNPNGRPILFCDIKATSGAQARRQLLYVLRERYGISLEEARKIPWSSKQQ